MNKPAKQRKRKKWKIVLAVLFAMLAVYLLLPTKIQNPVEGCGKENYHLETFRHPWGDHNHAGIDIFAQKDSPVHPAIGGVVVATAHNTSIGWNRVVFFGSI